MSAPPPFGHSPLALAEAALAVLDCAIVAERAQPVATASWLYTNLWHARDELVRAIERARKAGAT